MSVQDIEPMQDHDDTILEPMESKQDKEAGDAEKLKLQEFGKPVSYCKLLSLAAWPELFVYAMAWLGAIAHGAAAPAMCLIFGDMIDGFNSPGMLDIITDNSKWFCVVGAGVVVAGWVQEFGFPWFAERVVQRARPLYFDAAIHKDVSWYDTHEAGAFPAVMSQDLENLGDALGTKVGVSVMALAQLILGFALGFWKGWLLTLILSISLPLMGGGAALMDKSIQDIQLEKQGSYASAAAVIEEVLFAVRTVVAFGGETREIARFQKQAERARKGGSRSRAIVGAGMGYLWCVMFLSYGAAFYVGMRLRYDGVEDPDGGVYSIGRIMTVFFAIIIGGFSLGQIPPGLTCIVSGKTSAARIFHIIESESVIQRRRPDASLKDISSIESITLDDVHFAYPARPELKVLKGVNMTVRKGGKVAVVGESGSGKSTVMALLERFYDPLAGSVLINGHDLREISVRSYRQQIGYVGQEPVLFATSIKANIIQGCTLGSTADLNEVAEEAQLREFVAKLPDKFDTYVGAGGSQFSGGQKQRIAIARALIKKPSVLFLDEATSALDNKSEKMIQGTIDAISANSNRSMTIVSIAHRLSTVRNSDIIYVLSEGIVAEQGTHEDLVQRKGLYHALAATQMLGEQDETTEDSVEDPAETPKGFISLDRSTSSLKCSGSRTLPRTMSAAMAAVTDNSSTVNKIERSADAAKSGEAPTSDEYRVPLRRLFAYCKREWPLILPGIVGGALNGSAMPILGGSFVSEGMNAFFLDSREEMREEIEKICVYFVIGSLAVLIGNTMQVGCFGYMGEALTKRLRMELLTSVLRQEIGYHDDPEHTPGMLARAFQVYANRVSAFATTMGDKFSIVFTLLAGLILAFANSWMMALVILGAVPIMGISQGIQMSVQLGSGRSENKVLVKADQVIADAITNARTVHACGNEKDLLSLYSSLIKTSEVGAFKKHLLGGFVFGVSDSTQYFIMAGGFWFMGYIVKKEYFTFAEAMSAFMGLMFAAMGAGMASALMSDMAKAKVAAHDMFNILDREPLINGLEPMGMTPEAGQQVGRIEFQKIRFFYPFRPDVQVLKQLTFTVEAGTSVGLVGPSGGGKSTIMALVQRFYDPQSGLILVGPDRICLKDINIRWWRKQVGFVGQEPILFEGSVLSNVTYGLEEDEARISEERLAECQRMANLSFIQKAQGWETQVGPRGSRLSGGQKQRVAICRALVRNPPLLLLDEATSALDSQSEMAVGKALEAARIGRTSFAIAHRLSSIQDCDVIMVVGEGRILEAGQHDKLMRMRGMYYKLQEAAKKTA